MTSVSEAQLTSGLVELQVYGIVSLYEKYVPPADPNAKDKEAEQKEKDKDKDQKDPKDTKDPMSGTTTTPKMRVRRRVA
jgi:regulator of RNase E activity RraB